MTQTSIAHLTDSTFPAPSISLTELVSALQSLGIAVPLPNKHQARLTPSVTPIVSARISSPWVATSAVPLATSAPDVEHEGTVNPRENPEGSTAPVSTATPTSPSSASSATLAIPSDVPSGFMCQHCQQYTFLRPASNTWYAVTAGHKVGVFQGWHMVQSLVSGVPHASYRKYTSEAAATAAYEEARSEGIVVVMK